MMPTIGKIVLMGSGELTATMVEVHKALLAELDPPQRAVFLDTPAGFQLNVAKIAETAVQYFKDRVQHPLTVASFKSSVETPAYEAEIAFHTLRQADYVLIGPGSPTYAVRQIETSPIPGILQQRIEAGACLVAASAAALTVGSHTLPVYEIYKVGADLHWVNGLNLLAGFGYDLVVVPHWNNAEGGTHDTRRCFMGEARFRQLLAQLPEQTIVLGLDEHTACEINLDTRQVTVRGIGRVIVLQGDQQQIFTKGDVFPAHVLRGETLSPADPKGPTRGPGSQSVVDANRSTFWHTIHGIEKKFSNAIAARNAAGVTNALLEMDSAIWRGSQDLESSENISEAREILRDMLVVAGGALEETAPDKQGFLVPLVNDLLALRDRFRQHKQFSEADALRDALERADIRIEDTPNGVQWHLQEK